MTNTTWTTLATIDTTSGARVTVTHKGGRACSVTVGRVTSDAADIGPRYFNLDSEEACAQMCEAICQARIVVEAHQHAYDAREIQRAAQRGKPRTSKPAGGLRELAKRDAAKKGGDEAVASLEQTQAARAAAAPKSDRSTKDQEIRSKMKGK